MTARPGAVALVLASLILVAGWLSGRTGADAPLPERYDADPVTFHARVDAMIATHGYRRDSDGQMVVHPPEGDVPMLAKAWEFSPMLEVEAGRTYRLHLLAEDMVHSAALDETEILLAPGRVAVVTVTAPPEGGAVRLQCGEYCGLGHTRMIAAIAVVARR